MKSREYSNKAATKCQLLLVNFFFFLVLTHKVKSKQSKSFGYSSLTCVSQSDENNQFTILKKIVQRKNQNKINNIGRKLWKKKNQRYQWAITVLILKDKTKKKNEIKK